MEEFREELHDCKAQERALLPRLIAAGGGAQSADCVRNSVCPDPLLDEFVRVILPPQEAGKVLRGFYTDALHTVLLTRLAALREFEGTARKEGVRPLAKWRLKRAYEFVESNLENRITLQTLARAAGVSRMYFAAQFRAATGMRPHSYVIQRRMACAKAMLSEPRNTIAEIAFSVGFQTQSHFTTVFKRVEGATPHRWRELHGVAANAGHE